jgi:hypothetical protein
MLWKLNKFFGLKSNYKMLNSINSEWFMAIMNFILQESMDHMKKLFRFWSQFLLSLMLSYIFVDMNTIIKDKN